MLSLSAATLLPIGSALFLATHAEATTIHPRGSQLQWGPCTTLNTTLPVQCTTLKVPLDYTNESSNVTLSLDLIKYPATKGPSKGSILLNFGGPGQDGLQSMLGYAPRQSVITGGQHDLISWDPRGTGRTLRFSCWPDTEGYATLGQKLANSSDAAFGTLWAEGSAIAEQCYTQLNQTGDFVGMAFTARDMMQIVDALCEDGLLRYWGISGGTTLGSTVAALFPDRMDRVLLDGVMNSHQYWRGHETEYVAGADDAFKGFISACIANPSTCALARNRTVSSLTSDLRALFEQAKYRPLHLGPTVLDYSLVKGYIFSLLYRPNSWPTLAIAINALMTGDVVALGEIFGATEPIPSQDQAVLGIRCGDTVSRATAADELLPVLDEFWAQSEWFGDMNFGYYTMACTRWKFQAKERYLGNFNVSTRSPLLFIGSPYDPVTPLVSAVNMSLSFQNAFVVQHNGYGHTTLPDASNCTNNIIQSFFTEGKLPKNGTKCEPNNPLFANIKA